MAGPVEDSELASVLDSSGRLLDLYGLKKSTFHRGVTPATRPFVWKVILGYYPPHSTEAERAQTDRDLLEEYLCLKASWQSKVQWSQALQEYQYVILKDVPRTSKQHWYFRQPATEQAVYDILMTVVEHDMQLGYVQGMNDLLAPLLLTLQNEHEAFWCLTKVLERNRRSFEDLTLSGPLNLLAHLCAYVLPTLHCHLDSLCKDSDWLFCYRWLLLEFKREFPMEDICSLWERMWACPYTRDYGMFVAVGMLQLHKGTLMEVGTFEQLMQVSSTLSNTLPLQPVLKAAQALLQQVKTEACPQQLKVLVDDTLSTPPPLVGFVRVRQSLSTRQQKISHINVWRDIFGDQPLQAITRPLPPTQDTPPTSGFVPHRQWTPTNTAPPHTPSLPPHTPSLPPHTPSLPPHTPSLPPHTPSLPPHTPSLPPHTPSLPPHTPSLPPHTPSLPPHTLHTGPADFDLLRSEAYLDES